MNKNKSQNVSLIIVLGLLLFYCCLFYLLLNVIEFNKPFKMILYLAIYLVALFLINYLERRFSNRFLRILSIIICFPFLVLKFMEPFNIASINIIEYFIFSMILPAILYVILDEVITYPSRVFILISTSSIIAYAFNKNLMKLSLKFSPSRTTDEVNKTVRLAKIRLTYSFLNRKSIKFYIYFAYLTYLSAYSIFLLDNRTMFLSKTFDNAVMQAFFVFIAFDNLSDNIKSAYIKPSTVLDSIKTMLLTFKNDKE